MNVYCDSLGRGEPAEGNFFVPGLFQKEAAAVDNDGTGNDIVLVIPENTRAKAQERKRLEENKGTKMMSTSNTASAQLPSDEDHGEQNDMEKYVSESSYFKPSSSFSEGSSGPQEIWNQTIQGPKEKEQSTLLSSVFSRLSQLTSTSPAIGLCTKNH